MAAGAGCKPTGRRWIHDDINVELRAVDNPPDHDEWHEWTELVDEDGNLWYDSDDPDGYTVDADEFGPIPEELQ